MKPEEVWTYVVSHEITGPGYDDSGVDLYRGPKNRLAWTPAGSINFIPHPATIEIKLDDLHVLLTLYNPKTHQSASFPIPIETPLKVRPIDNIDLRVEGQPEQLH